jgi:hypothetical protein
VVGERAAPSHPRPLFIDARSSAPVRPSTRTTLSREVSPRTMLTRRAGTPARRATRRHSAAFAAPSTGGAVRRMSSRPRVRLQSRRVAPAGSHGP